MALDDADLEELEGRVDTVEGNAALSNDDALAEAQAIITDGMALLIVADAPNDPTAVERLAAIASRTYRAVAERYAPGEREPILLLANYWELRAASASVEATLASDRSGVMFAAPDHADAARPNVTLAPAPAKLTPDRKAQTASPLPEPGVKERVEHRTERRDSASGVEAWPGSAPPVKEPSEKQENRPERAASAAEAFGPKSSGGSEA